MTPKENIKNKLGGILDFGVCVGKDELDNDLVIDIIKLSHLLIGGMPGSGKSNLLHCIVSTLISSISPARLKFILIDSKTIELNVYNRMPHLLTPVITDAKKAILAMKWAGKEMDRRLGILQSNNIRNVQSYHETILTPAIENYEAEDENTKNLPETMPYIVIVLDGLSEMITVYPKEIESAITRLTQMSHIVGIHLILSTSGISNKIITEPIKASVQSRIAFKVSSVRDSNIILGRAGAEKLQGTGEILFQSASMKYPVCAQTVLVSDKEIKEAVKVQVEKYRDETMDEVNLTPSESSASAAFDAMMSDNSFDDEQDELYEAAREATIESGKASTSYIQRKLGIGYSRSAHLIDMLENRGVIGPANGSKPREVIAQETVH